jgi:hypothetical protein
MDGPFKVGLESFSNNEAALFVTVLRLGLHAGHLALIQKRYLDSPVVTRRCGATR